MFRKIPTLTFSITGCIWSAKKSGKLSNNQLEPNILVELVAKKLQKNINIEVPPIPAPPFDPTKYATMTDHAGRFSIRNVVYPGTYELRCGNVAREIRLTMKDMMATNFKHVEIKDVRRKVDLRKSPLWELMRVLNVSEAQVRQIQTALLKNRRITRDVFTNILATHGLSLPSIETRAQFVFDKSSRRGRELVKKVPRRKR